MTVKYQRGATKYRVTNPGLASLLLVNGKRSSSKRSAVGRAPTRSLNARARLDVIAHAERLGLLKGAQARSARRSRNAPKGILARAKKTIAGLFGGSPARKRKAAKKPKTTKEKDMRKSRKSRKSNRRRKNATSTRRRSAAKRTVRTPNRKTKKAPARKARKAQAKKRNARKTRRTNRKTTRRMNAHRAAPKRRRNYTRRTVGGRSRTFGPTWRFNPAALAPIRTRRYNRRRNTSAVAQTTDTIKGVPQLLLQGANVGGGYLLTALFSGLTDRISQGRFGKFNGLVSALGAMVIASFVPDSLITKTKIVDKKTMTIGIGLYGLVQLLKLVLPEPWRERLGVAGLGGGYGEYVNLPGTAPAWTATGSLGGLGGGLAEYVNVGFPNGQGQDAQTAESLQLTGQNPVFLADAMLTADTSKTRVDSMMGLGEYIPWGPGAPAQAAAGLGDYPPNMSDSQGAWWGNSQYASSGYPGTPASRWGAYGANFRGMSGPGVDFPEATLSSGPPQPAEFAAPLPSMAAGPIAMQAVMPMAPAMPMAPMMVPMAPAMPMAPGCPSPFQSFPPTQGGMPAGMPDDYCGQPAPMMPYGSFGSNGGLPILAYAPGSLPTLPSCSPIDMMGIGQDPNRTLLGRPW